MRGRWCTETSDTCAEKFDSMVVAHAEMRYNASKRNIVADCKYGTRRRMSVLLYLRSDILKKKEEVTQWQISLKNLA